MSKKEQEESFEDWVETFPNNKVVESFIDINKRAELEDFEDIDYVMVCIGRIFFHLTILEEEIKKIKPEI